MLWLGKEYFPTPLTNRIRNPKKAHTHTGGYIFIYLEESGNEKKRKKRCTGDFFFLQYSLISFYFYPFNRRCRNDPYSLFFFYV